MPISILPNTFVWVCRLLHSNTVLAHGIPPVHQWVSIGIRLSNTTGIILKTSCTVLTWTWLLQWSCTRALKCLSHKCYPIHLPVTHSWYEDLQGTDNVESCFWVSLLPLWEISNVVLIWICLTRHQIWFYFSAAYKKDSSPIRNMFPWRHFWVWSNGLFAISLVN